MKAFLKILGHVWMLPNSIFTALYALPLCALGQLRFNRFSIDGFECRTVEGRWLDGTLRGDPDDPDDYGWYGWASGCFIILREDASGRSVPHELRHVHQQMAFGILAPILYFFASVFIFIFRKSLHSYYDNPFEVDARRFAGQRIKIPRDHWADPKDRWAWW